MITRRWTWVVECKEEGGQRREQGKVVLKSNSLFLAPDFVTPFVKGGRLSPGAEQRFNRAYNTWQEVCARALKLKVECDHPAAPEMIEAFGAYNREVRIALSSIGIPKLA